MTETLYPIAVLVLVAAITPGPNNFIVLTAAARGFRATSAGILGILVGGIALLALAWGGAGPVLETVPRLRRALLASGVFYLGWLGLVMVRQAGREDSPGEVRTALPGTFLGVALFQIVNPKAWILVLTATAAMQEERDGLSGLALLATTFSVISAASSIVWACAGALIVRWLQTRRTKVLFDRFMGGLLIASALLMLR